MSRSLTSFVCVQDLFAAAQALQDATPQDKRQSVEWIKLDYALSACRDAIKTAESYQNLVDNLEASDDLETDSDFLVSEADGGIWVSSCIWVPIDETEG